ncbi:MAG: tetratricopeptide repeat protein [Kiritimatiellae bacterium]|nr:tetratricopeptide repeat protein [Kiritimatiellia bacterium]
MHRILLALIGLMALAAGAETTSALPGDRFTLAREFSRRGLHAEALKELESVAPGPGVAGDELAYWLGEEYRAVGRSSEALAQSRKIVQSYPKSRYLPYAKLAVALSEKGKAQQELMLSLDTKDVPKPVRDAARYHLAAHRAQSDNPAERRLAQATYLDLASSSDPRVVEEALYFSAMLSYRDKRYAEAAALFARLFKTAPNGRRAAEARLYAAWSNHLVNRHAETLALVRPLVAQHNEDASYLAAVSLQALEKRDEALAAFDIVLRDFPNSRYADSLWSARLNLLVSKGDSQAVLDMLKKRGDPPADAAANAFTAGYDAAAKLKQWKPALEYARRAAALKSPQAARARYMAGVFEACLGRRAEAIHTWTNLLVAEPNSPFAADALKSRAMEELSDKNYAAANRSFTELARRFPNRVASAEDLYWRGTAARGAGDLPEAERLFTAALAAKPTPEFTREIQLELAYLLQKRGEVVGAVKAMAQLLDTKAVERLPDAELAWLAENALDQKMPEAARGAAEVLERRTSDLAWRQIAAEMIGEAYDALDMGDAAMAAYRRAFDVDVRTDRGAKAALRLGELESAAGRHAEAASYLTAAVERAQTKNLLGLRMRAYTALAKDKDACGFEKEALGYYMLVATLFDDPIVVPPAMTRAAEILRKQGKIREADELLADLKKRYER